MCDFFFLGQTPAPVWDSPTENPDPSFFVHVSVACMSRDHPEGHGLAPVESSIDPRHHWGLEKLSQAEFQTCFHRNFSIQIKENLPPHPLPHTHTALHALPPTMQQNEFYFPKQNLLFVPCRMWVYFSLSAFQLVSTNWVCSGNILF